MGFLRRAHRLSALVALAGTLHTLETPADDSASEPSTQRLDWDPRWRRFDAIEYVATAVIIGAWAYVELGVEPADEAGWTGGILFDDAVRDRAVGKTRKARNNAAFASDVVWVFPMIFVHVDSAVTPLFFGGDFDLAWQMAAMNIQVSTAVALLSRAGHRWVARARPDLAPCEEDEEYDKTCFGGPFASFPSGHTSAAMGAAGLICAHHLYMPLYGNRAADWTACGFNVAVAASNMWLRLVADRHYLSDNIVGAILGFGLGFGLPTLLHYRAPGHWTEDIEVTPVVSEQSVGLLVRGEL